MNLNLVQKVPQLYNSYVTKLMNAPTGYKKVLGQKVPTVWELKRTFTSQLAELAEVAEAIGDREALDMCKGMVNRDEADVKANIDKINNL